MAEPFEDIKGNLVQIGDRIACAFRAGNTAELRVGTIIAVGEKKRYPGTIAVLEVQWDATNPYNASTSKIEADNGRYLKLTSGSE